MFWLSLLIDGLNAYFEWVSIRIMFELLNFDYPIDCDCLSMFVFFYLSKHHKASKHTKYVFIVRTKWKNVLWMLTYFFSDCIVSWLKKKNVQFHWNSCLIRIQNRFSIYHTTRFRTMKQQQNVIIWNCFFLLFVEANWSNFFRGFNLYLDLFEQTNKFAIVVCCFTNIHHIRSVQNRVYLIQNRISLLICLFVFLSKTVMMLEEYNYFIFIFFKDFFRLIFLSWLIVWYSSPHRYYYVAINLKFNLKLFFRFAGAISGDMFPMQ